MNQVLSGTVLHHKTKNLDKSYYDDTVQCMWSSVFNTLKYIHLHMLPLQRCFNFNLQICSFPINYLNYLNGTKEYWISICIYFCCIALNKFSVYIISLHQDKNSPLPNPAILLEGVNSSSCLSSSSALLPVKKVFCLHFLICFRQNQPG